MLARNMISSDEIAGEDMLVPAGQLISVMILKPVYSGMYIACESVATFHSAECYVDVHRRRVRQLCKINRRKKSSAVHVHYLIIGGRWRVNGRSIRCATAMCLSLWRCLPRGHALPVEIYDVIAHHTSYGSATAA